MEVTLGERTHDLSTRALVIGMVADAGQAAAVHAAGADIVGVCAEAPDAEALVAAVRRAVDVPVAIFTADPHAAEAACRAGAVLGPAPCPTVVVESVDAVPQAVAAGTPPDRIVIDVGAGPPPPAAAGCPALCRVTVPPPAAWATIAVAVIRGCRLVQVPAEHVRGARRVCDVLAAILEAPA